MVLEEEQMPIIDKLENAEENRVAYIPNPSKLHRVLYGMAGKQLGCWILVNTNTSVLQRYYCGNGYKA